MIGYWPISEKISVYSRTRFKTAINLVFELIL